PAPTAVSAVLEAREGGTYVSLTHDQIGNGEAWQKVRDEIRKGWTVGLENLQSVLETGDDLRFTRRPMLGIVGGDELTAEKAAELGVPVMQGIRIDGLVEGMGAYQAGLVKGDVLTVMDGQPITTWQSLIAALSAHQAGDRVEIVFYRGNEKTTATMELSRRPLAEVPPDPSQLAEAVQKIYEEAIPELESVLNGVSDDQASHHPTPGDWNAKEVIAHLIAGERDNQNWISSLVGGDEMLIFANNVDIRVKATVAVFRTAPALVDELKRAQAETVAMVSALPPEFVAHRGSYVKVGRGLLEALHFKDHIGQIRAAVQSAEGQ
ncbi:MAG: PDZ domain-containing protein, partial [Methanoregulaceae archaeon]|nr:PDZ domain-containing protein [Methanoregulaceae archaeon]